jgi:transcription antitermination factor NusG
MLKLSENPPIISPGVLSLREMTGRWWVGHTRSRFEKAFAHDLLEREIGYFLPMVQRVRLSGGRKRHLMLPLFPSYVFFCGQEEARQAALNTNRLCRAIEVADQQAMAGQLEAIERALSGHARLEAYPFAALGQRCRVKTGPFVGLEGIVVRRNGLARLVLEIRILGQGAAMEIDADLLEPVSETCRVGML